MNALDLPDSTIISILANKEFLIWWGDTHPMAKCGQHKVADLVWYGLDLSGSIFLSSALLRLASFFHLRQSLLVAQVLMKPTRLAILWRSLVYSHKRLLDWVNRPWLNSMAFHVALEGWSQTCLHFQSTLEGLFPKT